MIASWMVGQKVIGGARIFDLAEPRPSRVLVSSCTVLVRIQRP